MDALTLAPSLAAALLALPLGAQAPAPAHTPRGWELTGIPALNYNSDEGFGYGVILQAYNYGANGETPYRYTVQPTTFFTTRGRKDINVFFDAPHLLARGWRWTAFAGHEQQVATPYYGIGNATEHSEAAEAGANPYFYRYGREGVRVTSDLQRSLAPHLRLLVGAGVRTATIDATPFDSGTTLLAEQTGFGGVPRSQVTYGRVGLVWDTRDREVGTRSGSWIEGLVQHGAKILGGTSDFARFTFTARGYLSPTDRITFASRLIVQDVSGAVPFHELYTVQGSFKDDEGLGGSGSVRGLPKDRFAGKGLALLNNEIRCRAASFALLGKPSTAVLTGFVDAGRVWTDGVRLWSIANDLHAGYGGGVRLGYGTNMVIALDVGHSKEATAPIYIGLGYLF